MRQDARDREPDRYMAALLAPPRVRADLSAIAAFAATIGRIAHQVREPMMGEIRLQWWRDVLAAPSPTDRTGHPVADALIDVIARHALPAEPFERFIDAHGFDLSGDLLADDDALDGYLATTEGLVFGLGVAVLAGPDRAAHAGLRSAGIAYGLARALGRLPETLQRGPFIIPKSRLAAAGIDPAALEQRPIAPEIAARLDTISRGLELRARAALDEARAQLIDLQPSALPALLPLAMVEPYFAAQNRRGYRRLEHAADPTPLTRVWRMWRAHRGGRF